MEGVGERVDAKKAQERIGLDEGKEPQAHRAWYLLEGRKVGGYKPYLIRDT